MSQPSVRAAVVGLGRHGFRHLQAYQGLDDVQLAAVCDVRADQVATALQEYQGVKGYTDWQELLRNEPLDLISIVTNGPSHAAITIAAAERGVKHIFCEKPMATSVKDAREMIRACNESGTRLAIAHARRWVKGYQELQALFAEGAIGKLCHFSSVLGGGLFAGNGSHTMDLARMLSGSDAISVTAFVDPTGTPNPRGAQYRDPGAVALYIFRSGMRLLIDMFEDIGVAIPNQIVGSIGLVTIDEAAGRWEVFARQDSDREKPVSQYWLPLSPLPFQSASLDLIEMLAAGIKELIGDGPVSCSGEDGLAVLEMIIGAHISNREGNVPVTLPLGAQYYDLDIPLT